jgi:hypothetical protein
MPVFHVSSVAKGTPSAQVAVRPTPLWPRRYAGGETPETRNTAPKRDSAGLTESTEDETMSREEALA